MSALVLFAFNGFLNLGFSNFPAAFNAFAVCFFIWRSI